MLPYLQMETCSKNFATQGRTVKNVCKILLVLTIKQRKQNYRKIKANARNVVLLVALVIHYKFAETMVFESQHYYDFQVL